ncbi:MAG: TolC family protein, partial [Bacteroidota bacterium]
TLHQFLASMEQTFADYESAKLRMDLYEKQKTITQSAIRVLEASYSAGNSDFDELLKLEMEIIDYDLKILKAIVQSWRARSEMERYFVFDGNTD